MYSYIHIFLSGYNKWYIKELENQILTPQCVADPAWVSGKCTREREITHVLMWLQPHPIPAPAEAALAPAGAPRAASGAGTGGSSRTGAGQRLGWGRGRTDNVPCRWGPHWLHRYPLLQLSLPREDRAGERRGGLVPQLNFIHPSTVSQVAFRIRKSKKYIHRCSLVYLLTLCNLFALICFCLSWDFPF